MQDTKNVEMPWGDVPVRIRRETMDCNVCGRNLRLTEDENYVCEVCGNVGVKKSVWHP
jgi:transposase